MSTDHTHIKWKDSGVPVSTRFDDPYFSLEDGLAESCYVFLRGNDLPERFRPGFHIAELGFGSGLNFCAALRAWRQSDTGGILHYTAFEAYPMAAGDMVRALAMFPQITEHAAALLSNDLPDVTLDVIHGDARETIKTWRRNADAWFLDGFSPAKNPELWESDLMHEVARHTTPRGTAATYSAAGLVRRGLQNAGFEITRTPGFGRKRHMTRAQLI